MSDVLTEALSAPAGRLAEVLIKKLKKSDCGSEMPRDMRTRFDKLTDAEGRFGTLARVRFAAELSLLFERAPQWSADKVVPLFGWSSPEAALMWSARRYSNYIGSPELFGLMKVPFLALFERTDVSDGDRETYADWLAAMIIANQAENSGYPLSPAEARSALRKAGSASLNHVGHRLAVYMQKADPKDKIATWRNVVGPVFESIWPLDIELQTSATTFKLVQILRATGAAFPEAAETIIPFIRAEDPRRHSSVHSIADADDTLYTASPEKVLDLLAAMVGEAPPHSVFSLNRALERLRSHAPELAESKKFQNLVTAAIIH